jgi:hypothetical protein
VKCPICDSSDIAKYFGVKNSPLLQNVLYESELQALSVETVDADFFVCSHCNFLFNPGFKEAPYDKTYNNDQQHSEVYRNHLIHVADIIESHLQPGRKLLEIGCGNGALLDILFARGCKNIVGYDPANTGQMPFVKHCCWDARDTESYDIIVLRHTLEGMPNFDKFFSGVTQKVNFDGMIYLELTSASFILENASTQFLYNECPHYFSELTIAYFLNRYGFYVHRMHHMMGGAIFGIVGKKKTIKKPLAPATGKLSNFKNVCIWGISGRSIHFLTNYKISQKMIPFGVDLDPRKQGQYIPVTGQKIISPQECIQMKPDAIIVLNENYVPEVISKFDYPVTILSWKDLYGS